MKKIYSLIVLALCVTGLSAQNELYNFEDGQVGGWGNFGDASAVIEVVDNPSSTTANNSTKVLKHVPSGAWKGINRYNATDGVFSAKPEKISFWIYATGIAAADETDLKIKLDMRDGTTAANEEWFMASPLIPETWTLVEFDVSNLVDWDYIQFAFQNHVEGTFYYDNISVEYANATSATAPKEEAKVSTSQGTINVVPQMGSKIAIYALSGAKVYSQDNAGGNVSVNVAPGLYIVVVDNTSTKVVVK